MAKKKKAGGKTQSQFSKMDSELEDIRDGYYIVAVIIKIVAIVASASYSYQGACKGDLKMRDIFLLCTVMMIIAPIRGLRAGLIRNKMGKYRCRCSCDY